MDATKLKNQIKKFEEHLIVDHGLSQRTVAGYARALSIALRRLRKFCPDGQDIRKFILWMHEKHYSYSHIVNTSLAVEHYARFKGTEIALGRPRKPKRIIQNVLSESEVSRIIQATKNTREKAVICLLAYSGIRNGELCNIRRKNIDLGANQLKILGGKNKRDRVANIAGECTKVLIEYLSVYHRTADDFLFTTLKHGHPLRDNDLRKMVRVATRMTTAKGIRNTRRRIGRGISAPAHRWGTGPALSVGGEDRGRHALPSRLASAGPRQLLRQQAMGSRPYKAEALSASLT
jgi:site-specific recombinase XerD